jgi:UDP-glucose 4-epimerase
LSKPFNILIIGGSSYVAKSFIELSRLNSFITVISRSSTEFVNEIVISDFDLIPEKCFENIDAVINCAAIVHKTEITDQSIYNKTNFNLALHLASKAKSKGVKFFVQLSTIAVYGQSKHINKRTHEQPINPYGISKLLADKALFKLADKQFNVIIIRPPMIYGGKNPPGNMMRLIKLHLTGIPLPFKGIKGKRDFIHIRNLINFIDSSICRGKSDIYLVSDNNPVSISNLTGIIYRELKMINRSFKAPDLLLKILKIIAPDIFDKLFGYLTIDVSESIQKLNIQPDNLIEQGIKEMVEIQILNKQR